ncbi:MAG: hypothetical protein ACKOXF_09570 [Chitinophagaceae bacterium]
MKFFRHYSAVVGLLSLVLFYSSPLKSLHACNNLIHHHDYTAFETAHDDCSICDHSANTFDCLPSSQVNINQLSFCLNNELIINNEITLESLTDFNKGPPSRA